MGTWKGVVGLGLEPDEFGQYVSTLHFAAWRPQFVVLHNTAIPKLADWHQVSGDQRMKNLEHFYRDVQGWSAGPHLFVADDLVWVFTLLTTPGVHSPSWNTVSWGIEMVGDYETESFDAHPGVLVRDNAVSALVTLHALAGLDPGGMRLHREDPKTTHHCPGGKVDKDQVIARVRDELLRRESGDHPLDKDEAGAA